MDQAEQQAISVSDFLNITDNCLKNLGNAVVIGEISYIKAYTHLYFTLKDENSSVDCLMFTSKASSLNFKPAIGMQVVITGQSSLYKKNGQFKLIAYSMKPAGHGMIMEKLRLLKEKLQKEGVFDLINRPLPRFPDRVGVITSEDGRVIHDIAMTLQRRCSGIELRIYNAKVQGEGAAKSLIAALKQANAEAGTPCGCDILIIGRGGGSFEDLLPFSDEALTRAVAHSKIPIISAVGHEPDIALTDFAADVRAATPTAAAELVSPHTKEELQAFTDSLLLRMSDALGRIIDPLKMRTEHLILRLQSACPQHELQRRRDLLQSLLLRAGSALNALEGEKKSRLLDLQRRMAACDPMQKVLKERSRLHDLVHRMDLAVEKNSSDVKVRFERLCSRLNNCGVDDRVLHMVTRLEKCSASLCALNPLAVLIRGYSITFNDRGHAALVKEISKGDKITTMTCDGVIESVVEQYKLQAPGELMVTSIKEDA